MIEVRKYVLDLRVVAVTRLHERYVLLRLTQDEPLPEMLPGQFVEVRVDGSPSTFLRRPISINFVDRQRNELWLLVATVGDGTRRMAQLTEGDTLNMMGPLGRGFTLPGGDNCGSVLLVGGGVGVAPLLYLGATLVGRGVRPTFLLGARTANDLLLQPKDDEPQRELSATERRMFLDAERLALGIERSELRRQITD